MCRCSQGWVFSMGKALTRIDGGTGGFFCVFFPSYYSGLKGVSKDSSSAGQ